LSLVAAVPTDRRARPPLRNLLSRADRQFQAKLVLLLGRIGGKSDWLAPFLSSADDRLRANAVEALWGDSSEASLELLRAASKDSYHRAAANAFVGLHRAGDPTAAQGALAMITNASPLWRAAGAWALGLIGGEEYAAELRKLMNDSDERVRGAALRAMVRLRKNAHLLNTKSDS
jgi:HEAT repeat protein